VGLGRKRKSKYKLDKKKLLVAKDKNGYIAWNTAALFGSLEALKHYGIGLRKRI